MLTTIKNSYSPNIVLDPFIMKIKSLLSKWKADGGIITFVWIKGHNGIESNEVVDILAKNSIKFGTDITNDICMNDCINVFKNNMKKNGHTSGNSSAFHLQQDIH